MALESDDLRAISALLDEALTLAPAERERWLASLPEGQRVFRPTLEKLLAQQEPHETNGFMRTLPKLGDDLVSGAGDVAEGRIIGGYRLLREIGRGGMGSVWLAERSDGLLDRQVALKLPHGGWHRQHLADQFGRERDILASLEHPNIARLYDAGVTPEGQPFMALAYVPGRTLIEHADALKLGVRERIELFMQVLGAVQYAHAHLVIHRDIKPSNVLVDERGQVQLLDFGIAKLMVDGSTEATQLTQVGGRMLTPDFASPEQINGSPLSTSSDVYSSGVLLYELLAGVRPYRLGANPHVGLEQAILAVDPAPPASVVTPAAAASRGSDTKSLAKALRGDLDAIVLKALQKQPGERYASAAAMLDDLQRHLDGEPVLAQPYSALYRMRKFVGRHRLPVALAGAAVAALLIGAGAATWQASVAARERDNALRLLARNEAVNDFLDMFVTEAAQSPKPLTAAELLVRSERLADGAFRQTPEHQGLVLAILGKHQMDLGELAKAEALMARALAAAAASPDASFKAKLECQRAVVQMMDGNKQARDALQAQARRSDIDAQTAAVCEDGVSFSARMAADGPLAVDAARRALARLKTSSPESPMLEAQILGSLAYGLHLTGRNDLADTEFARASAIYARLGREGSAPAIDLLENWATMHGNAGDPKAAAALYDQAIAVLDRRGIGDAPPAPRMLTYRARLLAVVGRGDEAAAAYARALALAERVDDADRVFICLLGQVVLAVDAQRLDEAEAMMRRIVAIDLTGRGKFIAPALRLQRARIAQLRGRLPEARTLYDESLAGARTKPNKMAVLIRRAELGLDERQWAEAAKDARTALDIAQSLQGGKPYSINTGLASLVLGRVVAAQGDAAAARRAYQTALLHLTHTVDPLHAALRRVKALLEAGA